MYHDIYSQIQSIDTLSFNTLAVSTGTNITQNDTEQSNQSRVAMIYTGGTIGMKSTEKGLAPAGNMANRLADKLFSLPEARKLCLPDFDLLTLKTLIDSSNALPEDWYKLAGLIWQLKDSYQGFILLHGTDTLAYTASALSFLTCGLGKPVIVTGSQYPLEYENSDAPDNTEAALRLAREETIQETLVTFGGKVLRGNRCTKTSTFSHQGFSSPNAPEIGHWKEGAFKINQALLSPVSESEHNLCGQILQAAQTDSPLVSVIKLYPGIRAEMLQPLLSYPVKAAVLETYGSGNIPDQNEALLELLHQASEAGIAIINRSQCPEGPVSTSYAAGSALTEAGVIAGHDITCEAAFTKLHCLIQAGLSGDQLKHEFSRNLCGEMSL
ncbi:asparaginase [Oceanospirillum sediminis]|uniref:asparaginase n=1 Tax=Oceanospirillum sediminis TaxID=2760088 RepID=A0A839IPW2_9GAMM|nr:asparaginase [Oceanospirillum sediminis]MBB1486740.1 asparaginase [Oceanospirillum sediminis]